MTIKEIIKRSLKYSSALLHKDKRTFNEFINRTEYMRGKIVLRSTPSIYVIGITNICNLQCPLCITGLKKQKKTLGYMSFELFQQIIEKIKDNAKLIQLYNWGEPLLHKDLIRFLEYSNRYDLNTEMSSNLSLKNVEDKLEGMVKYRLKRLIVSFDGVTQKDYERYRINGELGLVLENIKKIKEYKERYNTKYPVIILQFLKNKYTDGQIKYLKENYKKWGADEYLVCDMTTIFKDSNIETAKKWFDDEEIKERKYLDVDVSMHGRRCYFLYTTMIIDHDGTVAPCCFTTDPKDDFTRWDDSKTILEMYNSEKFLTARRMFKEKNVNSDIACNTCTAFITFCDKNR